MSIIVVVLLYWTKFWIFLLDMNTCLHFSFAVNDSASVANHCCECGVVKPVPPFYQVGPKHQNIIE